MIKVIIFDFDGVIAESLDIKTKAFARLFDGESEGDIRKIVDYHLNNGGVSRYEKFKYIYKEILHRALNKDEFETLCTRFSELVVDNVVACPYVKGAKEFLERYTSTCKCFVVSATPKEEIREIIDRRNIGHFFAGIYGAPDKKTVAVKEILKKETAEPGETLYVGDAMSDYLAAKDNGIHFIVRIRDNEPLFRDIDCLKITDLSSLEEIIETHWR